MGHQRIVKTKVKIMQTRQARQARDQNFSPHTNEPYLLKTALISSLIWCKLEYLQLAGFEIKVSALKQTEADFYRFCEMTPTFMVYKL